MPRYEHEKKLRKAVERKYGRLEDDV